MHGGIIRERKEAIYDRHKYLRQAAQHPLFGCSTGLLAKGALGESCSGLSKVLGVHR